MIEENPAIELELRGRTDIYIPEPESEVNEEVIREVLGKAKAIHERNKKQIDYLWNYFLGEQPILSKTKEVRPEINSKVLINHAHEVVSFYLGYVFGDPIQYTQKGIHGVKKGYSDTGKVAALNELMDDDCKASKDNELAYWLLVSGWGYRMALPYETDDAIFETETCDPRNTFVINDTGFGKKTWMCVLEQTKKGENGTYTEYAGYTKDIFFICNHIGSEYEKIKIQKNYLGRLPIIQYKLNYASTGCFEPVISIMNMINLMNSNRSDGALQHVQSFMKMINVDIDDTDFEEFRKKGLIKIKVPQGVKGDVDVISVELDQIQMQTYVDSLYQNLLQIAGVPDRNASAGGNTGQALIVGQGWSNAEARAKSIELSFKRSEKQFISLILEIIKSTKHTQPELKSLFTYDVDIKFTRNKTDSLLVKAQALLNLLDSGLHPRIAFSTCGLFSDPEQAFIDSEVYLKARLQKNSGNESQSKKIDNEEDTVPKLPVT